MLRIILFIVALHAVTATYLTYKPYFIASYDVPSCNLTRLMSFIVKKPETAKEFFPTDAAYSDGKIYYQGWATPDYGSNSSISALVFHNLTSQTTRQSDFNFDFYLLSVYFVEHLYALARKNDGVLTFYQLSPADLHFTPVATLPGYDFYGSVYDKEKQIIYVLANLLDQEHGTTLFTFDIRTYKINKIGDVGQNVQNLYLYKDALYTIYNAVDPKEKDYLVAVFIDKIDPKSAKIVKTFEYKQEYRRRAPLYAHAMNEDTGELLFVWSLWNYDENNIVFDTNKWEITAQSAKMAFNNLVNNLLYVNKLGARKE
jgi:hypothetical protein